MEAADAGNDIASLGDKATEEPVMIESASEPVAVVLNSKRGGVQPSRYGTVAEAVWMWAQKCPDKDSVQ